MNPFAQFADHVRAAIAALAAEAAVATPDLSRVTVEPPREEQHGDLAVNAAMVLAKDFRSKPRDLAEKIAKKLGDVPQVRKVEIAGPGFINVTLDPAVWLEVLRGVIDTGADFGRAGIGKAERVNVEYVSANPTGPMHVGHGRGAVFGDALANLLAFAGFKVTREYYVNDAGAQVDVLARSAYLRYREALGESIGAIPEGLYPGDYLVPVGKALAEQHGKKLLGRPETEWLPIVREAAIATMMDLIRADLAALSIRHDVFFSERSLSAGGADRVRRSDRRAETCRPPL